MAAMMTSALRRALAAASPAAGVRALVAAAQPVEATEPAAVRRAPAPDQVLLPAHLPSAT